MEVVLIFRRNGWDLSSSSAIEDKNMSIATSMSSVDTQSG